MTLFEMVKYHNKEYPIDIPLRIEEVAGHLDIRELKVKEDYSLHTEYSYGKRKFNTPLITKYPELSASQKDGVPQLWKNEAWASQFADFIFDLTQNSAAPTVIEIHPPFTDYTNMEKFINSYSVFEAKIKDWYPSTEILIENRCGSVYHGGRFLVSKLPAIEDLCSRIEKYNLSLMIAYDVPQIYTAYNAKTENQITALLEQTKPLANHIGGVHLWGKCFAKTGRRVSHCGTLDTYFESSQIKDAFLQSFRDCFNDDITRKMVLEVNSSNDDLLAIVSDLKSVGIEFK